MTAAKSASAGARTARVMTREPGPTAGDPARAADRERTIASVLDTLPPGFIVFNDLQLLRPTRASIDHLVIGPRGIWAVSTSQFADPVTLGTGRNADTLWAGRSPLRASLEATDWAAVAVSDLIGYEVEPMACIAAPSLPEPAFDFHGIRICGPADLGRQVTSSHADFIDVNAVSRAVSRTFGVVPTSSTPMPTLRPRQVHRVAAPPRWPIARTVRSMAEWRWFRVLALGIVGLVAFQVLPDAWNSVAESSADRVIGAVRSTEGEAEVTIDEPPPVRYIATCPSPGGRWEVAWLWPGALPAGVAGYGIRIKTATGWLVDQAGVAWSDSLHPPESSRLDPTETISVITEFRDASGTTLAATEDPFRPPSRDC